MGWKTVKNENLNNKNASLTISLENCLNIFETGRMEDI